MRARPSSTDKRTTTARLTSERIPPSLSFCIHHRRLMLFVRCPPLCKHCSVKQSCSGFPPATSCRETGCQQAQREKLCWHHAHSGQSCGRVIARCSTRDTLKNALLLHALLTLLLPRKHHHSETGATSYYEPSPVMSPSAAQNVKAMMHPTDQIPRFSSPFITLAPPPPPPDPNTLFQCSLWLVFGLCSVCGYHSGAQVMEDTVVLGQGAAMCVEFLYQAPRPSLLLVMSRFSLSLSLSLSLSPSIHPSLSLTHTRLFPQRC